LNRCLKITSAVCFVLCSVILMFLLVGYVRIPDEMTITQYDEINVGKTYVCQALSSNTRSLNSLQTEYSTSIKLFNIFPIKSSRVKVTERKYVVPGGNVFGIRLYTKGVMIVRIDEVTTSSGNRCPGTEAGLKTGDMILSVDGVSVTRNKELASLFASSNGKTLKLLIERDGKQKSVNFTPVKNEKSAFTGGLWVRDSTAGIGTVTWCDRENGIFAGLGHAVCDVDTGEVMPLSGGDAVEAIIKGCYKGKSGSAGELCGVFSSGSIGNLYINGDTGVYGVMNNVNTTSEVLPTALRQEVKTGAAQIICTVDDSGPKKYNAEIKRIINTSDNTQRNMIIKITDEALIEKTGGIVQGMSGSPIIQNGMLVGAVTHVFIDDPTEGYGIFAQNMLETAENVESYIKKAG